MAVVAKFCIPKLLVSYCGGRAELTLAGRNLGELLKSLEKEHPELLRNICDESGRLRPHVNLFVNDTMVPRQSEFTTKLKDSDIVSVFQAVSGG